MAAASRDQDYGLLERELQSGEYEGLLRGLQHTELFLRQFRTWEDVIAFMRTGTSADPRKDEILRPILRAHGQDSDPRWRTILLAIFWPGLKSLAYRKRHWEDDPEYGLDELWQNIIWTFLKVVCRLDVSQRPARLVQKIMNDTNHDLYQMYKRRWDRTNRELPLDQHEIESLAMVVDGVGLEILYRREAAEQEIDRLRGHRDAGRISDADCRLLVATRVNGMSVADYARDRGLNYEVAKKRRQRAEAVIRRFEENVT